MIRTQLQLPENDYQRLQDAARRQGRSMADCIREGIRLFLHAEIVRSRDLSDVPAFHAGSTDDLKDHDRWWADQMVRKKAGRKK